MSKTKSRLLEIAGLLLGTGVIYLLLLPRFLHVISIDKQNRTVTFLWKKEKYTWTYADGDEQVIGDTNTEYVVSQKIENPVGLKIFHVQKHPKPKTVAYTVHFV
jgi:hypothetical protein